MKQGWTYIKLGSASTFMSGYTPNKDEIQEKGQYPYFKVAEMNKLGNEIFMVNTSLFVNHPKKVFPKGSIVFPKNGGAIYTEKKRILKFDSVIDLNTEALSPNDQVNTFYLFYFLNHLRIAKFDKGGGLPSLDLKKMADALIPIPPLPEQERIVERLDAAFAQIDELKNNAERQLAEARALFQSALTQVMQPKPGWQEKKFKEICRVINGRAYAKHEMLKEGKYRLLRVGNFFTNNQWFYSDLELEEDKYCDYGDLLYAWSASFGPRIWDGEKVIYHYHIWKMICSDIIDKLFLFYWLDSDMLKRQTMTNLHGTTMAHITKNIIENSIVVFPSMPIQKEIASNLDSISRRVKELEEISRKTAAECDALKQALLRQIFE